jgi:alpha-L-fucosidase
LNVGPKSDGTIPEEAQTILLQMGAWLNTNGEAIYGSRPWLVYGEGPTRVTSTARNSDQQVFTPQDIRFTTNKGALYAIALGWPEKGELQVHTLYRGAPYLAAPICSIELLGSDGKLSWTEAEDGLHIKLPATKPDEPAFTFRILTGEGAGGSCSGRESAAKN